jgi:hypothetical protein
MKFIIAYAFLLTGLITSCTKQTKSAEFSGKADGRIIFMMIQEYRSSNNDKFPNNLRELDYSALQGGLVKDGKIQVDDWQYLGSSSKNISPDEIILRKTITQGRVVNVRANGNVFVEGGQP